MESCVRTAYLIVTNVVLGPLLARTTGLFITNLVLGPL
jgi:hypothetical protein